MFERVTVAKFIEQSCFTLHAVTIFIVVGFMAMIAIPFFLLDIGYYIFNKSLGKFLNMLA
jgi:hypothetical protein